MKIETFITKNLVETFRETMLKYYELAGMEESYKYVQEEHTEELIVDAFTFATKHFLKEIYEIKKEANQA